MSEKEENATAFSSATPAAATNRAAVIAAGAGIGRRKEAVARVRLTPGTGRWIVNNKNLEVYFPNKVHQQLVSEPFRTVGAEGTYDVFARIDGGGTSGQAGAARHGITRALIAYERAQLKSSPIATDKADDDEIPRPIGIVEEIKIFK